MTPTDIARAAHETNKVYCHSIGDDSQEHWEQARPEQQSSCLAGVEALLADPTLTPQQIHEKWMTDKLAAGWKLGETKDFEQKTHPCIRPYRELPVEQRAKDSILRGVVMAMRPYLT